MQSWPAPTVPALPGRGPQLRLFDSADRQVRPVTAGETATMYVCGITPYDATHLGHAATYLAFDLVHRIWLDSGHTGALRAEHHRRRRSPVRAGRARRYRLARAGRRARPNCSARTWRRCGCCPHTSTSRPPRRSPRSSRSSRRCWPRAQPMSSTTRNIPTYTSAPTPLRSSATSRATTATPCCGCSPNAEATRTARARATNSMR